MVTFFICKLTSPAEIRDLEPSRHPDEGMEASYMGVFNSPHRNRILFQEGARRFIELNNATIYNETCLYAVHLRKIAPVIDPTLRGREFEEIKELAYHMYPSYSRNAWP